MFQEERHGGAQRPGKHSGEETGPQFLIPARMGTRLIIILGRAKPVLRKFSAPLGASNLRRLPRRPICDGAPKEMRYFPRSSMIWSRRAAASSNSSI